MDAILTQLNGVTGVVGCLVCQDDGGLEASALPAVYGDSAAEEVAKAAADGITGLSAATGQVESVDLKFANARVLVRAVGRRILVVLCTPAANQQLLAMTLAVAAGRLEKVKAPAARPAEEAQPSGGELYQLIQRINASVERRKLDGCKVRGEIGLKAGFGLGFIYPDSPDDANRVTALKAAAFEVLGEIL